MNDKWIWGFLIFLVILFVASTYVIFESLNTIGQQIDQQGGMGKTIGHFLRDINQGVKEASPSSYKEDIKPNYALPN